MSLPSLEALLTVALNQPWLVLLVFLVAPLMQEDAALILAAGMIAGLEDAFALEVLVVFAVCLGLAVSALAKYALGAASAKLPGIDAQLRSRAARKSKWVLRRRLGASTFAARFIPGTRIAFYLACGAARAPVGKLALFTAASGLAYLALAAAVAGIAIS